MLLSSSSPVSFMSQNRIASPVRGLMAGPRFAHCAVGELSASALSRNHAAHEPRLRKVGRCLLRLRVGPLGFEREHRFAALLNFGQEHEHGGDALRVALRVHLRAPRVSARIQRVAFACFTRACSVLASNQSQWSLYCCPMP